MNLLSSGVLLKRNCVGCVYASMPVNSCKWHTYTSSECTPREKLHIHVHELISWVILDQCCCSCRKYDQIDVHVTVYNCVAYGEVAD